MNRIVTAGAALLLLASCRSPYYEPVRRVEIASMLGHSRAQVEATFPVPPDAVTQDGPFVVCQWETRILEGYHAPEDPSREGCTFRVLDRTRLWFRDDRMVRWEYQNLEDPLTSTGLGEVLVGPRSGEPPHPQ